MRGLAPCVLVAALVGCAPPPAARFTHATATQENFLQDRYVCIQQAQQQRSGAYVNRYGGEADSRVIINRGVYDACMAAKGYKIDPNGNLAPPPGMQVMMVD